MENTFQARLRSDKRKTPALKTYRYMTYSELVARPSHVLFVDRHGDIAQAKVTTVKTWKTRAEIEVHCKYGMYEYFNVLVREHSNQETFVIELG